MKQKLSPPSRRRSLALRRSPRTRAHGNLLWFLAYLCCVARGGRTLPVVYHLRGQDSVEGEARDEAVQYQLIIHLLQRREDSR